MLFNVCTIVVLQYLVHTFPQINKIIYLKYNQISKTDDFFFPLNNKGMNIMKFAWMETKRMAKIGTHI